MIDRLNVFEHALSGGASHVFATLKLVLKVTSFEILKAAKPDFEGFLCTKIHLADEAKRSMPPVFFS
jgi:hypothetical protein